MTQTKQAARSKRIYWIGAVVLVVLVFFIARSLTRQRLPVRVASVVREDLTSVLSTNGKVEPINSWEAHSPITGQVTSVLVTEGENVPAGKLLMTLDDTDAKAQLATAASALKGAEANLQTLQQGGTQEELQTLKGDLSHARTEQQNATAGLTTVEKLEKSGAASAAEVIAAHQRLNNANQNLAALNQRRTSRYSQTEIERVQALVSDAKAGYAAAKKNLQECQVRAPYAGTVYSLSSTRTEFVEQGKLLLQVADLSDLQVRAYFDEPEIGRLLTGQRARITWDAKPGREWRGAITRLPSNVILYGTRNVGEAIVSIDQDDRDLLPNTNVTVAIQISQLSKALVIPREALHTEKSQSYVYRLIGDSLYKTPISVAAITLTKVAVSSGLKEKDVVALSTLEGQTPPENVPVKAVP
jgi:HlyD family secretion protein